jgi:hypothetical protein
MADTGVINLEDAKVVEKCGRGRHQGRKNKPKASIVDASSSTLAKHRRGRPLGSKNKVKAAKFGTTCPDAIICRKCVLLFLLLQAPNAMSNSAFL